MGSVQPTKGGVDVSVALAPCNIGGVPKLVEEISCLTASATSGDEAARLELAEKARSLVRSLETPRETMIKHCWAQVHKTLWSVPETFRFANSLPFCGKPTAFTAIAVGVDIGLFKLLAESDNVHNANDLATMLGVEPPLLCMGCSHTIHFGERKAD